MIYLILVNQVVSEESAIIGDAREMRSSIHANHIDMAKFSTRVDPGYKSVLYAMEMLLEGLGQTEPPATFTPGSTYFIYGHASTSTLALDRYVYGDDSGRSC
jgi:hypothetical protein